MVNCAVSCIKYIIFAFNFLFFIIGVSILGGGIYVIAADHPAEIHAGDLMFREPAAPYVLIGIGAVIAVIAFLGCCGAIMQNTCMLMSFAIVMLVLLVTQLGIGLYALIHYDALIEKGLFVTLNAAKDQQKIFNAWENMQYENRCCGVNQPSDWEKVLGYNKVPVTCCPEFQSVVVTDIELCSIEEATKTGCKEIFIKFAKDNKIILWSAVGFSIIILAQFIGIVFTFIMFNEFRKKDRELRAAHHSLRYRSNIETVFRPTAPKA